MYEYLLYVPIILYIELFLRNLIMFDLNLWKGGIAAERYVRKFAR
jgi:hypothetical protein